MLRCMREKARIHDVRSISAKVDKLRPSKRSYEVMFDGKLETAKTIPLAIGVVNHRPAMDGVLRQEAVERGLIRYCPICDSFKAVD